MCALYVFLCFIHKKNKIFLLPPKNKLLFSWECDHRLPPPHLKEGKWRPKCTFTGVVVYKHILLSRENWEPAKWKKELLRRKRVETEQGDPRLIYILSNSVKGWI